MANDSPVDNAIVVNDQTLCYQHDKNTNVQDVMAVDCVAILPPSRYLIIRIPGNRKFLQLCEVEIQKDERGMRVTLEYYNFKRNKLLLWPFGVFT